MRKFAFLIPLWLALIGAPVQAQNTNTQLLNAIATQLASGQPITATELRGVLNQMVNSTNVQGSSCPGSSALTSSQPWANNTASAIILNTFDGTNCLPWAFVANHGVTISGAASNSPGNNIIKRFGSMDIAQRTPGGGLTVGPSATGYTIDGCYLSVGANEASNAGPVPGIIAGSYKAAGVFRNSGQTGTGQITFGCPLDVDEIALAQGHYLTFSFYIGAYANWSPVSGAITANVLCGTGSPVKQVTGFTGQSTVITLSQNLIPSGSIVRLQATSAVSVPFSCTQMEVQWTWSPTGSAGALDGVSIDEVQLEVVPGPFGVASPFQVLSFAEQLALARRHYWKSFVYATAPAQAVGGNTGEITGIAGKAGTSSELLCVRWPVQMRLSGPALVSYNPSASNGQIRDNTIAADLSGVSASNNTSEGVCVTGTGNASTAVGDSLGVHLTADAGI